MVLSKYPVYRAGKSLLIECKTKVKESKSISIQKDWIEKLKEEAFAMRRPYWAITFNFGDNEDYFIINEKFLYISH